MSQNSFSLGLETIKHSKLRSLMTMLGMVLAVAVVVVVACLGQGAKNQILNSGSYAAEDSLQIRSGQPINYQNGEVKSINFAALQATSSLTENDVLNLKKVPIIAHIAPTALITANVSSQENKIFPSAVVLATNEEFLDTSGLKTESGNFFTSEDNTRSIVVIGKKAAEQLFGETAPIGRSMKIRGIDFLVRGVLQQVNNSPVSLGVDLNNAVIVPYGTGKNLVTNANPQLRQIDIKLTPGLDSKQAAEQVYSAMLANHGSQADFTVISRDDAVALTNKAVDVVRTLVGILAAAALLVGGIGVMNIMVVSVTERTYEIGIRKSVGATNRQIMQQFTAEAIIISLVGALMGLLLGAMLTILIGLYTTFPPAPDFWLCGLAVLIATAVGTAFGCIPAMRASKKDPIEALRHI